MPLFRPWLLPAAVLLAAVGAVASPASAAATSQNLEDQNLLDRRIAIPPIQNSQLLNSPFITFPSSQEAQDHVAQQSSALTEATRLNRQAIKLYREGKYAEAIPLAKRALAIREKALGPNHPAVATILNNLANLYDAQGNYAESKPFHQRALTIREKALGPDHPDVANSLNNLAVLYRNQGNYVDAELLLQRTLAIYKRVREPNHPDIARSPNNLAEIYKAQGNYTDAAPLLQQALTIYKKTFGSNHPKVAGVLNNLSGLYHAQGRHTEAELSLQQTLAIYERTLPDHPEVATVLSNLAVLYSKQGNYAEADTLLTRALAILEKKLGRDHPQVALIFFNLAAIYHAQGNRTKAVSNYQRALSIWEKKLGSNHPLVATTLNNLAAANGSLINYQRALAIYEKSLGPNHPDVARVLNNIAWLLSKSRGNYTEAEPLYQRSLTILEKTLGAEHPNITGSLNNLAGLYQAQGKTSLAIAYRQKGAEVEETNLVAILYLGSERRKRAYLAKISRSNDAALSLHLQGGPNNADAAHLALTTLLRRKGRTLDATSSGLQMLRQNLTAADQQLLDQLDVTRSQLANLIFKGVGDQDPAQYRQQVAELKGEADQLETQLSQRSAEFRIETQPVTIAAVQQQIPTEATLVELVHYQPFNAKATGTEPQWGSPRYAAYVLQRQGKPKWVDLGEAKPIDARAADFAAALRSKSLPAFEVKAAARDLDKVLFAPIQPLLGSTRHLLISPDSQLNLIPFAALVDEQGRYRVESYQITYLTAGRDLLKLQLEAPSRQAPVLVADASFHSPGDPTPVKIAAHRGQRASDFGQLNFQTLPGTKQEIEAIAPLLPQSTVLTQSRATENAIKQVEGPEILHIATHGFFLKDAPLVAPPDVLIGSLRLEAIAPTQGTLENPLLRSGLALAGANKLESGSEDGILTALEVSGINLYGTQLVVLSACETGIGEVANGEGVYGQRRALVLAGSRSQTISLWKVDDLVTKDWMVAYYQKLKQGVGRSEAVRQVQLQMLSNPQHQHPYYWAAFIPSGDWRPMQF